jgi:hypothetical protein
MHNKYGRPSQYSMFSLIDENDEDAGLSYYSILVDLMYNKVKFNLNKFCFLYRYMFLQCLQFVVYCLLSQEFNFGFLITCRLYLK